VVAGRVEGGNTLDPGITCYLLETVTAKEARNSIELSGKTSRLSLGAGQGLKCLLSGNPVLQQETLQYGFKGKPPFW